MGKSLEFPNCNYPNEANLITPSLQTPNHFLYLSNLDINLTKFQLKYIFLFKESTCVDSLKLSLSIVLVDYYPFAGRLRNNEDGRVEIDCNGKGALFAEGFLDLCLTEFLEGAECPNESWKKLLYPVDASSLYDAPPLIIQVIHLNCGGTILLTSMNHALCDASGASQFLNAWAEVTRNPSCTLSVIPSHSRLVLKPQTPPNSTLTIPEGDSYSSDDYLRQSFFSQPLVPISVTFTPSQILHLKKQCIPSINCTSFEVLAAHVWCTWVKSLELPASLNVKLILPAGIRKKMNPNLPDGYYGNAFVPACAESTVDKLISSNLSYAVELLKTGKEKVDDAYIRYVVEASVVGRTNVELPQCLVISSVAKLGLEEIDFGNGKPVHVGPTETKFFGMCLPVIGDFRAFKVFLSVPWQYVEKFESLLKA